MQLKNALAIIRSLMELLDANKENLRSDMVLKMNILFEEACRLEKKLLRDTSLTRETTREYRQRVAQLYKEMRESKPSQLTEELRKIVDHKNYLGLTSIISKFVKSFLKLNLKPLLKEREMLRTECQKLKYDETEKD
jgi:adenylosuccinate lyase